MRIRRQSPSGVMSVNFYIEMLSLPVALPGRENKNDEIRGRDDVHLRGFRVAQPRLISLLYQPSDDLNV